LATARQRIVYILKNAANPPRFYTGVTSDFAARLAAHNAGRCCHTAKYRPWAVDVIVKFADDERAVKLERYLKTGSASSLPDGTYAERRLMDGWKSFQLVTVCSPTFRS